MKSPISPWSPQFAHRTDDGARGKHNDDSFDYFVGAADEQNGVYFLTVADGVTSNAGGDQASDIAVTEIRNRLENLNHEPLLEQMTDAVHYAHRQILGIAQKSPDFRNMSTTIVLAAIDQDKLYITHLGDSRAYLIRNNQIHLLTVDHTWVQDAIDQGRLSAEEAKSHPNRHVIKRFLGIQETISIDYNIVSPTGASYSEGARTLVKYIDVRPNDLILLCTDGLTNKITDDEICSIASKANGLLQEAIDELIDLALSRQEGDNITAVLMKVAEEADASHHSGRRLVNMGILVVLAIAILMLSITAYTLIRIDGDVREWILQVLPLFHLTLLYSGLP